MISKEKKEYYLTGRDGFWIICILVLYGIISFINLGSMSSPQTFWNADKGPDKVILDLGQVEQVNTIRYFSGARFGSYEMYISTDGMRYDNIDTLTVNNVFYWEDLQINESFRYLMLEPATEEVSLGELALYNANGERLTLASYENAEMLVDEQSLVPTTISYLNNTYFDEIYHARTAYEYIHDMTIYEWTHPPLGKLLMTIPIRFMGMTPFAYRVMGNIAGLLLLIVIYVFAKRLFGSTRYAALAMLLFAADGMHFVQTRIGTVDSYLVLFMLLAYLFMYQYICCKTEDGVSTKLFNLFASGLFMGCAIATKWNGAYCGVGLAIVFFVNLYIRSRHARSYGSWRSQVRTIIPCCFVFFVFVPILIYLASYIPFFITYTGDNAMVGFFELQEQMYNYHSKLDATHPFSSRWYLWPIGIKPVWYYKGNVGEGMVSSIACHSNPFIWWTGILGMLYALKEMLIERKKSFSFLIVAALACYVPYMFIPRIMYLYHYFPVVPLMILMTVGGLKALDSFTKKRLSLWYAVIAVLVFAFFYPIYSGAVIPEWYASLTTWLPAWILY